MNTDCVRDGLHVLDERGDATESQYLHLIAGCGEGKQEHRCKNQPEAESALATDIPDSDKPTSNEGAGDIAEDDDKIVPVGDRNA